ncbi:hypothetical protein VTK56DRAFT_1425 [Thermocarpiscus australiensis]
MRIRLPFAGIFAVLLLLAGYAGLSPPSATPTTSPLLLLDDKLLHLLTFFLLTLAFYWVVDTTRRRALHLTLVACTLALGVGSEVLQALLPNGRAFDFLDVVANLAGSLAGVGLCAWYHKRMLERRRRRKYTAVPTTAAAAEGDGMERGEDLELGEGPGIGGTATTTTAATMEGHEEGVMTGSDAGQRAMTLEEEVDNWDENAVDAWDEDDLGDDGVAAPAAGKDAGASGEHGNAKKRSD